MDGHKKGHQKGTITLQEPQNTKDPTTLNR